MATKKIVVEAGHTQDSLENDGADATCECETLKDAKARAKHYVSASYAKTCETSDVLGYARVLVNGENVFDVFSTEAVSS